MIHAGHLNSVICNNPAEKVWKLLTSLKVTGKNTTVAIDQGMGSRAGHLLWDLDFGHSILHVHT